MRRPIPMVLLAAALAAPAAARGDGGPISPAVGGAGVSSLDGSLRFVALDVKGGTVVESLDGHGAVRQWRLLRGRFAVPAVAYDGSATGLSVDGRTLVLAQLTGGPTSFGHTKLVVLDTRTLGVRQRVSLPGYFTLDALSPGGRRLYLTHYTHPRVNTLRYEVRAYDLARHRLGPHPIVDPREPDEKMLGIPFARTMSAGGRWAYTLYDKADGTTFVHALDTVRGRAFCVDLDVLRGQDTSRVTLAAPQHGPLRVLDGADTVALIDRRTFAVSRLAAAPHEHPHPAAVASDGGPPWVAAAGALAALAGLVLVAAARRRYVRSASLRNAS